MAVVLQIEGATKTYRRRGGEQVTALRNASLKVHEGEFEVVHGPSGSGKSTLLLAAGGLLKPEQGKVMVNGKDLYAVSSEERAVLRARNIGYVFQQFHLIPFLSVLSNVLTPTLAVSGSGLRERARELITEFGLEHRIDHPPSELSTGERQRVALARALLHNPKLLLADEPTGNLDEKNAGLVITHLREFARSGGAVLMVTHDSHMEADARHLLEGGVLTEDRDSG